jgi:hypothetical protein
MRTLFSTLSLLVVVFLMSSCISGFRAREAKLQSWLDEAKRPVKVTRHSVIQNLAATRASYYYTLVDSNGKVYLAENVRFVLPEVIE